MGQAARGRLTRCCSPVADIDPSHAQPRRQSNMEVQGLLLGTTVNRHAPNNKSGNFGGNALFACEAVMG